MKMNHFMAKLMSWAKNNKKWRIVICKLNN